MDLGLEGKRCVVTGASRGIGLEAARRLSREGGKVLLVARDGATLAEASRACGGEFLALDLTAPGAAERVITECVDRLGGIDVLVNNAGTTRVMKLDVLDEREFDAQWRLHVLTPFRLMSEAAPRMAAAGGGRIVNVSSSSARRPNQQNVAYSVTKAAQLSLSRAFADRWAADGVLVNAITPGPVATELWTGAGGLAEQIAGLGQAHAAMEMAARTIPLGRFAEPGEVADVIVFLCSARASTVVGAAWSADGGTIPVVT